MLKLLRTLSPKLVHIGVIKQLIKELLPPVVIALAWCVYARPQGGGTSIADLIGRFVSAMFVVNWFSSHYLRVLKQARLEGSLKEINKSVSSVIQDLKDATKELISYQTGGDSFCYLMNGSLNSVSNTGIETVVHQGKYPLFDTAARITDIDEFNLAIQLGNVTIETFTKDYRYYGALTSDHALMQKRWDLGDKEQRSFNIFWTTRSGDFTQLLRFKKVAGQWHYATKVIRQEMILLEKVSEGYPRNVAGNVVWEEPATA